MMNTMTPRTIDPMTLSQRASAHEAAHSVVAAVLTGAPSTATVYNADHAAEYGRLGDARWSGAADPADHLAAAVAPEWLLRERRDWNEGYFAENAHWWKWSESDRKLWADASGMQRLRAVERAAEVLRENQDLFVRVGSRLHAHAKQGRSVSVTVDGSGRAGAASIIR